MHGRGGWEFRAAEPTCHHLNMHSYSLSGSALYTAARCGPKMSFKKSFISKLIISPGNRSEYGNFFEVVYKYIGHVLSSPIILT